MNIEVLFKNLRRKKINWKFLIILILIYLIDDFLDLINFYKND